MVEDIKQQQKQGLGTFKNCLAVCCLTDILGNGRAWAMSLGLVVSELSEEPVWKGKVFLDNGGEIGPHQLMEAAIADKEYQALSVVD
ncbi:hypothetical protein L3X38_029538 [Prunus dulcis]|uniref:Uncharacterized protein n=1 Tax=Prunus dulcis TaxID=3755 RepID=A0AAD4VRT9_PRUDU|nr:hypothetical protein L3X38_029538 [Prunus dulcis]